MPLDPAIVFIGSSAEGRAVAREFSAALTREGCEPTVWDEGVFAASTYTLPTLLREAHRADFAVLVATPDDMSESRGTTSTIPRDNVMLEFGLFVGAIGLERVYLLPTARDLRFPSDVAGLTSLPFAPRVHDDNLAAALGPAASAVRKKVAALGRRVPSAKESSERGVSSQASASLRREIDAVDANARAQGWRVRTNNDTTLRLDSPRGHRHTLSFSIASASADRTALRGFVAGLRADGLRVNSSVRRPPN